MPSRSRAVRRTGSRHEGPARLQLDAVEPPSLGPAIQPGLGQTDAGRRSGLVRCLPSRPRLVALWASLDRPWPGAGWPIVPRPGSPSRGFRRKPGPSFATCSNPANRWPTRRPGPTKTAATSPAAPAGTSSTCRSRPEHYDPRDCRRGGCVVSKIAEFRSVLLDPHVAARPPADGPSFLRAPDPGPSPADARRRPKRSRRQQPPAPLRALRQHQPAPGLGFGLALPGISQ